MRRVEIMRVPDCELYDAEYLAEQITSTTNSPPVSATVRDRIPELRDVWRRSTGA